MHAEAGAASGRAEDVHLAAEQCHQSLHDVQSKARAADRRIAARGLTEHFKDHGEILRGDADAGVLHHEVDPCPSPSAVTVTVTTPASVELTAFVPGVRTVNFSLGPVLPLAGHGGATR